MSRTTGMAHYNNYSYDNYMKITDKLINVIKDVSYTEKSWIDGSIKVSHEDVNKFVEKHKDEVVIYVENWIYKFFIGSLEQYQYTKDIDKGEYDFKEMLYRATELGIEVAKHKDGKIKIISPCLKDNIGKKMMVVGHNLFVEPTKDKPTEEQLDFIERVEKIKFENPIKAMPIFREAIRLGIEIEVIPNKGCSFGFYKKLPKGKNIGKEMEIVRDEYTMSTKFKSEGRDAK